MTVKFVTSHPMDKYLRTERLPHIWCPGCGIGSVFDAFLHAVDSVGIEPNKLYIVSGIGCTGRAAGYAKFDSFHTTHGRPIPFAVGLKQARPDLHVVVMSGDGDLFSIGGNHFVHAARRNNDILVIAMNNFTYGMTGGQVAPTTPTGTRATTSPYGNLEHHLNLPYFASACGATYVARWSSLHVRRLKDSFEEALQRKGFRFIEAIGPCPTAWGRINAVREGLDMMRYLRDNTEIRDYEDPKNVGFKWGEKIIVGKFKDEEKPTFEESMAELREKLRGGQK